MASIPDGQQVAAFLGQSDDVTLVALAAEHIPIVTAMVRAYTRDNGFTGPDECAEGIAAVITTATARLVANPEQVRTGVGSVQTYSGFNGWTLAETFVLNRYRKRSV